MRPEYGMRRQAVDGEMGLRDKLLFHRGGEEERLYLSFDYLFLAVSYLGLLSAECIRNVTRENGWSRRDSGRARKPQRRAKVGLNVITDRGDKDANYQ